MLAQPSTDLDSHSWARLTDGTPLVTHAALGAGQVVLFHVTSTAEWSNLPLSGLFVSMLEHLIDQASGIETPAGAMPLAPYMVLDGDGALVAPLPARRRCGLTRLGGPRLRPRIRRGCTARATAAVRSIRAMTPRPLRPRPRSARCPTCGAGGGYRHRAAAAAAGRPGPAGRWCHQRGAARAQEGTRACRGAGAGLRAGHPAHADDIPADVPRAALETRLAYIVTGHEETDDVSREGLQGPVRLRQCPHLRRAGPSGWRGARA
ncbi:hypothetical protein RAA17_20500 [Komagataeibacter rhaeticus]|nr:hypothetical protein [Komagataeibacter rhaeticus]